MRFEPPDFSRLKWKVFQFHVEFLRETPWAERGAHVWSGILHGRLKRALRDRSCQRIGECKGRCYGGVADCRYAAVFQPDRVLIDGKMTDPPSPLILRWQQAPASGDSFKPGEVAVFDIVFLGPAMEVIGDIVQILSDMSDAGPRWTPEFRLLQVVPGIDPTKDRAWLELADFNNYKAPMMARIHVMTPWVVDRKNSRNRAEPEEWEPRFPMVWTAVHRRIVDFLRIAYAPRMASPPDLRPLLETIQTLDFDWRMETWCFHKEKGVEFSGLVGSLSVTGDLQPFWGLLAASQLLHIGGKAGVGAGRIELEVL